MTRAAAGALAALLLIFIAAAAAPAADDAALEKTVLDVSSQLRCVVCQSLSVADSPSETARQMRDIVRERLAAGQTPEQVKAYFVEKYGTWILLAPPARGFSLLVWVAPFAALGAGLVLVAVLVARWSRRPRGDATPRGGVDEATRERIRREMEGPGG